MSAKLLAATGVAALALSGCGGITTNPVAGSPTVSKGRGKVDDPRTNHPNHLACLKQAHLPVIEVGRTWLQIGTPPAGPKVYFAPTPGAAQAFSIEGEKPYRGAEVIGSALLYPEQGSDSELQAIEACLAQNVTG
jgi:hypothetical protein